MVWVPKRGGREADVDKASRVVPDGRATHYWDGARLLVGGYKEALALPVDAWDIYFLYGPEARWDGPTPPKPHVWMHQLWGVVGPQFDPVQFAAKAAEELGRPTPN